MMIKAMKMRMKIKRKASFLQTSLHLSELSPDSRYELTVNVANRKVLSMSWIDIRIILMF